MMCGRKNWLWACIALFGYAAAAGAEPPFVLTAQSTGGTPQSVTSSGSNVVNLVRDVIKDRGPFEILANQPVSASLRYGGIDNAVQFSKNAAGTSTTLSIPSIKFQKTFTGNSASDVEHQIEDFAKKNGSSVYGDFIRSVNEQSPLGVTDGNPLAATALLSDYSYNVFGLQTTPFAFEDPTDSLDATAAARWRLDSWGGYARTTAGSGYFIGGAISLGFRFGDRVGLTFATPFTYRTIEGAQIYNVGEEISLPILIIAPRGNPNISWLLTPTVIGGAAGSLDVASGGVFAGGGLTSSLTAQYHDITLTLADQIDYFHGVPLSYGDYKLDTHLEQEVIKNGVKLAKGIGRYVFVDAGITRSDFLQKAAIDHYWSPTASVGLRFGQYGGLRVGYVGDFGHGYNTNGGNVSLYVNF